MAITLPLMIWLYEFSFFKESRGLNWKRLVPFLLTLLVIPLTMLLTRSVDFMEMRRAVEPVSGISVWHYLLTQFKVVVTYIRLIFLPVNQNIDYDYPAAKTLLDFSVLSGIALLSAILIFALRAFRNYRLVSFGIFWFFLALLPESSIIPITDVIFEHRLYLSIAGYGIFLTSGFYYLFKGKRVKLIIVILGSLVIFYSILAYHRNGIFRDEFTLWNDAIRKSPLKARPYNNRGAAYGKKGGLDQAILDYNKAIAIDPEFAEAYYNRGIADFKKGGLNQAISDFNKAVANKPEYARAYNNRGLAYFTKGSLELSINDYNKAIEIFPEFSEAYNNRGNAYNKKGGLDQAILDYDKAIAIDPGYADAYYNRGITRGAKGDLERSIDDYSKAIAIDPKFVKAYCNRGIVYSTKGDLEQAISNFSKAIAIDPKFVDAYYDRAVAYLKKKQYDGAWADARESEALGHKVDPAFIELLKEASGREK
jgi:protein O-mannosyl-transferase